MNRHTFVIRIFQESERVWGQVSDSNAGWQSPFHNLHELWEIVGWRLSPPESENAANRPPDLPHLDELEDRGNR